LPFQKTVEQRKEREKLFKKFDVNNNGFLNLNDVLLGVRKVLGLCPEFISNPVITCAFHAATDKINEQNDNPLDQNTKLLFSQHMRILLAYIRS